MNETDTYISFYGTQQIAVGVLADMLSETTRFIKDEHSSGTDTKLLLIFNERTGEQVDFDLRGSVEEVLEKALPKRKKRGVGRPKLGVTSREITLLPRHWKWLEAQPKSISATIRLLVEEASKRDGGETEIKKNIAVIDRIMLVMAGDLEHFEEASRALNARNTTRFEECVATWPDDIKSYLLERLHNTLKSDATQYTKKGGKQ